MRALLGDAACLKHDDLVSVDHGRKPVRDDDGRAAFRNTLKRRLNFRLRPAVQRAGRFVQYQKRRIFEQSAGNRHTLLFAARQFQSAFAHFGGVLIR